jgi:hypothetical protein
MSGCVTVDIKTDPAAGAPIATYGSAISYLVTARGALLEKAQHREHLNDFTKAAVGGGVGGAGVGALFHAAVNPILGFLTFGAIGYAVNQDINPVALDDVYRAGISNLDCIRASAVVAYANVEGLRPQLTPHTRLDAAIQQLASDVDAAGGNPQYSLAVTQAIADIKSARAVSLQIDSFLSTDSLGEQIVSAVDGTLSAVNQQALARSPSVDAVLQSGSTLSTFVNTGGQLSTKLQTARAQLTAKGVANGGEGIDFTTDRAALAAQVALIPDMSIGPELAAIGACHAQFSVLAPVTVSPSPVSLTTGGTVALKITGNAPFYVAWDAGQPPDVHVDSGPQVSFTADADATPKSYVFHVVDKLGTPSDAVTLTVAAPPDTPKTAAPAAPAPAAPAAQQKDAPSPPPSPVGQ